MDNLFGGLPGSDAGAEQCTDLLTRPGTRIERIVSTGQATPPGEWLVQDWDEWVLLVAGSAALAIEGTDEHALAPGDHLLIPAGTRHRVNRTDPDRPTIWLAVHLGEGGR
jgi:cupin 2 domain-containing protein